MAVTLATRFKAVMPFIRVHSREDERYGGIQAGFTTYHETESGDEEYRTTYMEWGGRSDHITAPLASALGQEVKPLTTDSVSSEDADYVRPLDDKKSDSKATDLKVVA